MKKLALLILLLFATAAPAFSQTNCSPFMGLSTAQFWDNAGNQLVNGALYVFAAGSTQQASSFQDSQCSVLNVNPITFGSGARATIWLNTSTFYKFVLCAVSTDGPFCNASDVLFSVDNVPGGSAGGGGGTCSAGCTGFFISGTPSPSTSGVLRLASSDSFGWRNQAGSGNILFSKTAADILQWGGGSIQFPAIPSPASSCGGSGFSCLWADNTANRWLMKNNGGSAVQVVASGNDIDVTDAVKDLHFGSTQIPTCSTAPTANQFLQLVAGCLQGGTPVVFSTAYLTSNFGPNTGTGFNNVTGLSFSVAANTKYKITCDLDYQVSGNGIQIQWTGPASPTFVTYDMLADLTTGSSSISPGVATAFSTALSANSTGVTATNLPLRLTMTLSNGANAGTVQLQAANTGAASSVTIIPGSCSMQQ